MKKEFRGLGVVALTVIIGSGGIPAAAQQRQTEQTPRSGTRVMIERGQAAQDKAGTSDLERQYFERDVMVQAPAQGDYVFLATEMSFGGLLVKGAPYSAQAVTESTQTLTDGNRIVNRSTAAVYRDGEGRTRREQTLKAIGLYAGAGQQGQTIFINDPVAGTSYTLDPATQTARKMAPLRFKVAGPKSNDPQTTAPWEYRIAIEGTSAQADGKQYRVVTPPDHSMDKRQMETGMSMGWLDSKNPAARTENLGKQNLEGVEAEGTRSTVTIPAGKIGNELPIDIVSERWYSPALQVIVMTRHTDPRFGENSYKLTNINRSEPARELFEVPAGYAVKETPTSFSTAYGSGAGGGTGAGAGAGSGSGGGTASGSYAGPITGGMLNGKAISLPLPAYPSIAKAANASGSVTVQITIDEEGNVISASAASGHPLLRAAAVSAAREAKFSPTKLNGQAVKVAGMLLYNFVAQ